VYICRIQVRKVVKEDEAVAKVKAAETQAITTANNYHNIC